VADLGLESGEFLGLESGEFLGLESGGFGVREWRIFWGQRVADLWGIDGQIWVVKGKACVGWESLG